MTLSCAAVDAAAHERPDQDIEEIVVVGRWTDLAGSAISASEGIVGQEELDIRPRLRTGEVLEVVPGLIITQHSGTGKSHQMFLRGFNLDHGTDFSTSTDGMPVNLPSHGHGQGYTDLNFLIPELIESVEFRKCPYHADVGDDWDVMLMGHDASWNAPDQIAQRAIDSGLVDRLGSLDPTIRGETSRYSVFGSVLRSIGANRHLHAHAYAIDYDLDLFSNFTYFLEDPVNGDQFERVDRRTILGGDLSYLWSVSSRFESTYTVGMSLRRDDVDEVGLFNTQETARVATVRSDKLIESTLGVYAQAETRWNDRWRTLLGIRADYFDFSVRSDLPANSGDTDDAIVAPKVSVIYALDSDSELYVSTGHGFHSNDARGTTIRLDPVTREPVERVDPVVASTGAELGFRTFRNGGPGYCVLLCLSSRRGTGGWHRRRAPAPDGASHSEGVYHMEFLILM